MSEQETEFTLGIGKLLGLFFGLVVLCAGFFVAGYWLGKNPAVRNTTPAEAIAAATAGGKPPATRAVSAEPGPASAPETSPPANPSVASEPAVPAPTAPETNPPTTLVAVEAKPLPQPASPANGAGYIVQVAAVSKQQDAEALVEALRKKQYPVFVANQNADSLFHVQICPFSDPKEAEATRARLMADGYNPIVKK